MFKRFSRWLKTHKLVIAITVIVALVLGYFTYQKIALELNKRAFTQARTAIDKVYADIVSKVGHPDNSNVIYICNRRYQEFTGHGDITCHIDRFFIYGVVDEPEANNLLKKIQKVVNSQKDFISVRPSAASITNTLVVDSYYRAASDRYRNNDLNCVVNYIFDTPREIDLSIKDKTKKPFEVTIGCYGPARQQYYLSLLDFSLYII